MAEKAIGAALRAPRKQSDIELDERHDEASSEFAGSVERELRALIARHGPDPDRIVALLAERKPWERRRAGMILAADYGREAARFLIRSAENHAIYDNDHPVAVEMRAASKKKGKAGSDSLAKALKKRAAGKKARLPASVREAGRPLPAALRSAIERTAGESAADIRVVTGPEAAEAAAAVGAIAVTTDRTILLGEGRYNPDTPAGAELLAHEAVHALQQRGGDDDVAGLAGPAAEHEADHLAGQVAGQIAAPQQAVAAPQQVSVPVGRQAVARQTAAPSTSASATASAQANVHMKFSLGPLTVDVDLEAKASATVGSGGVSTSASASATTKAKLDTAKLNPLLPKGITITQPSIDVTVQNGKLTAPIQIKAEYAGKEPYLKKVPFTFNCDTNGALSAKLKLDLQIPGFCKATSEEITLDKSGVSGDIKITKDAFTIPGTGKGGTGTAAGGAKAGLTISGGLVAHVKNNDLEGIDGDAQIQLPQGFGSAAIKCTVFAGRLLMVTADLETSAIPSLGHVTAKLFWSQGGGFELKDLQVPIERIPGLQGSVNLSFQGGKFTATAKSLKFTAKALEKIQFEDIKVSEAGLEGTAKVTGANLDVPGWLKISNLKGAITLKDGALSAKDVSAAIEVAGGKAKGTLSISYVGGDLKAKGTITKLDLSPNVKVGPAGISFDLDLGNPAAGAIKVTGDLLVQIGQFVSGKIENLGFSNGYFTGRAKLPFKSGILKGLDVDIEILASAPWVKADLSNGLVGKKLSFPFKGSIPVEVTCTKSSVSFTSDLTDLKGSIGGTVKVDGGKLAEGDFDLKAEKGHFTGDLKVKVKPIPGLKMKGGEITIHAEDEKLSGGGSVDLEFDRWIKGPVKVAYDSVKGFSVVGKGLTVDIPGFPFDVKPFDVSYENGKFAVRNVVGTLKAGQIPGVQTATCTLDFVDNKLKASVKDVAFTLPQLKKTTLSATWDDGKWSVSGSSELTLPKGLKAVATFGASNGGTDGKLNFNCKLEVSLTELKKLFPGVEVKSGKVELKYDNGKLSMDNAELGLLIANGVLDGVVKLSLNEDHSFNGSGNFALKLKFIKAKDIEVKVDHNELKRVAVTGLELDLPKGKGTLSGNAALENGKFNCDLTATVTDVPWVDKATATVGIKDGKWEKFQAQGTFKKTPGIDLSGVTIGGKLEGGSPAFFADGKVPIKGIKEPLAFHFLVGDKKWEVGLKGTFEIQGLGTATVGADLSTEGFKAEFQIQPKNDKLVKAASGWVQYAGGNLTFGGSITVVVAKEFEGTIKFEKLADGDFVFKGKLSPTKAKAGESGKHKLVGKDINPPGVSLPYGIPGFANVHVGAGVKGGFEAGLIGPAFNFMSATVSGKLSELEHGDLPDAEITVKPEVGAYASANLGARVYVGASLLGASLDLSAEATGKLEGKAVIEAPTVLKKEGNSYTLKSTLQAQLGAALSIVLALRLILDFLGAELWSTTLGSKELALGNFNFGEFPLKDFEYHFGGPAKKPTENEVAPSMPDPKKIQDAGLELGRQKVAEAKDAAVEKIKSSKAYKVAHGIYEGAKKAWNFITSW